MTRMIFVRHGESTGNLWKRFYGHTDGALTDRGAEQAKLTAEYLKDIHIDVAYASDLVRAYETGKIISAPHGLVPIPCVGLREIYAGEWEDCPFETLVDKFSESFGVWLTDLAASCPDGGESVAELAARVSDTVWKLAAENDEKTLLIATHATPIRALECEWRGLPLSAITSLTWVPNASVSIVDYDVKSHKIIPTIIGDASFMGGLITKLPEKL